MNKVTVITGAGGVLCSAFAKVLAADGWQVALLDLNYRANLWSKTYARETLSRYLSYIDLLFANNGSLYDVFGIDEENSAVDNNPRATLAAAKEVSHRFDIREVALTMRQSVSASHNKWSALLYN